MEKLFSQASAGQPGSFTGIHGMGGAKLNLLFLSVSIRQSERIRVSGSKQGRPISIIVSALFSVPTD
ncbi:hypothetical protein MM300_08120 [Evansella sp. LMS18]|uniref:hypothetical protein n=1 Tax=Evansella sp. LMS18 TaxID=2924033 RepID=UPI0020D08A6F|nr:hypothetical protein [Evansella sp. LMS18]UTR12243.1 hypothetical protein MM300_08120 [Evansella sp. LMS18]